LIFSNKIKCKKIYIHLIYFNIKKKGFIQYLLNLLLGLRKNMKIDKLFFWACEYKSNSGEGRLGRLFLREYKKKNNYSFIKISLPNIKFLHFKYISPFVGILYAWIYFFSGKKFLYLNYLPYWNFLIFFLLPPKCEIGPITGGAFFSNDSNDFIVRKYFFPILYSLSNLIVNFRFKKLIFSTDLLKKFLTKKIIKKSKFNFIFKDIKLINKNTNRNKKIKFLIYFREHNNKNYVSVFNLIYQLKLMKIKTHVIGDKIKINGVKNYGYIPHKKVISLLKNTKFSTVTSENIFSFFTIDCINNNVKILVDSKKKLPIKYYNKHFLKINFKKINLKKFMKSLCQ